MRRTLSKTTKCPTRAAFEGPAVVEGQAVNRQLFALRCLCIAALGSVIEALSGARPHSEGLKTPHQLSTLNLKP